MNRALISLGLVMGLALIFAEQSFAALNPPRELFRIADTNPRYEELVVAVDTDVATNNIRIVRIYSGSDLLYSKDVQDFTPGGRIQKVFITIVNESFYADRGGRMIVFLGDLSVPLDVVRQGNYWIAETNGKRVRKITVEVQRMMGIPIGVNEDIPIAVSKFRISEN